MNRFNIVRGLAVMVALATGGCFAAPTSGDTGQTEDELASARVITFEGTSDGIQGGGGIVDDEMTHPTGTNLGPQPDPWYGDNEGPQPDPWVPRARPTPPSPPEPESGTPPSDGSGKK
jgi:hypothetical protein